MSIVSVKSFPTSIIIIIRSSPQLRWMESEQVMPFLVYAGAEDKAASARCLFCRSPPAAVIALPVPPILSCIDQQITHYLSVAVPLS